MNAANIILTIALSAVALIPVIAGIVRWVLHHWAIEEGLIRPRQRGQQADNWPGDFHSLPDALEAIYDEVRTHHPEG